ncbi:MAG: ASKHA domain-containing protein [Desulfitobacteriaceae bacterium]|nr:ASKHA domain-containing protein [Desulfitobacteriaceae bacterium]
MEDKWCDVKLDPLIRKCCIKVEHPSLNDQCPDWERLKESIFPWNGDIPLFLVRRLPKIIRETCYYLTLVIDDKELLGIEKGDATDRLLGMAFDIGTTTVVGYLVDLNTGRELCTVSAINPQVDYGADVISRITFAAQEEQGLQKMHKSIIEIVNDLIVNAAAQVDTSPDQIYALLMVGNTCMHHFFMGINPAQIALYPYVPVIKGSLVVPAKELGVRINPNGRVYALSNIGSFVGSDAAAVIMATGINNSEGIKLVIDVGANCEIILGNNKHLYVCSTAAGSAFEGSQILCGMGAVKGAIDHVKVGHKITYTVIGGAQPQGICGSGLIDVVAGLLNHGIINGKGDILSTSNINGKVPSSLKDRIIKYDGANAFLLVGESAMLHNSKPIIVTQRDVRELQLAKGAIRAGIQALMDQLDVSADDIEEVLLAGSLGNQLDPASIYTIGMLPLRFQNTVRVVGHAAGVGAKAALLCKNKYEEAELVSKVTDYLELSAYNNFNDLFASYLAFPPQDQNDKQIRQW